MRIWCLLFVICNMLYTDMYKRNTYFSIQVAMIGCDYCSDIENGHISLIKQVEYQLVKRISDTVTEEMGNFGSSSLCKGLK